MLPTQDPAKTIIMSKLSLSPEFALQSFKENFPGKPFADLGNRLMYLPENYRDAVETFSKMNKLVESGNYPVTVLGYTEAGYKYIYVTYNN